MSDFLWNPVYGSCATSLTRFWHPSYTSRLKNVWRLKNVGRLKHVGPLKNGESGSR